LPLRRLDEDASSFRASQREVETPDLDLEGVTEGRGPHESNVDARYQADLAQALVNRAAAVAGANASALAGVEVVQGHGGHRRSEPYGLEWTDCGESYPTIVWWSKPLSG